MRLHISLGTCLCWVGGDITMGQTEFPQDFYQNIRV
jgi:hypothetical protein